MLLYERKGVWMALRDTPMSKAQQNRHPKEIMICLWWDFEDLVHWEVLEENKIVGRNLHIAHHHSMNEVIQRKRSDRQSQVILLHDSARPHIAYIIKAALQELDREVLHRPRRFSDLTLMDFHLFGQLSNQMRGLSFDKGERLENLLSNFFESRSDDFWRNNIVKVVERWEQLINNDGDYIINQFVVMIDELLVRLFNK